MATVGQWAFNQFAADGRIRDLAVYARHLTLDAGATLQTGGPTGNDFLRGGAFCDDRGSEDYIKVDDQFGAAIWVRSSDTALVEQVAIGHLSNGAAPSILGHAILLSDVNGFVSLAIGSQRFPTTVSVRDGEWHHIAATYDGLDTAGGWPTRIWIDGVLVRNVPASDMAGYNPGGRLTIGRDYDLGARVATGADFADPVWFNDPIYTDAEVAMLMEPMQDRLLAAYSFDTNGEDVSVYQNHLVVSSNAEFVPQQHGNGIAPLSQGGDALAQGFNLDLGGGCDRVHISCWVTVKYTGTAAPFLSLEDAAGNPKVKLFRGSAGGFLAKFWRDDGQFADTYISSQDGVFEDGVPSFVVFDLNPTGARVYADGVSGGGMSTGQPPIIGPIISDIATLRVGGIAGNVPARVDNLRIIKNFMNGLRMNELRDEAIVGVPTEGTRNIRLGADVVDKVYVGSTPARVYVGDTLVYGD